MMTGCRRTLRLWILALGGVLLTGLAQALEPVKGEVDHRDYRYLTLENGLQVLLISDPEADKAAAALDVHIGHQQNPLNREGLAHFLEHMLFLGTEKYPEADAYQSFISRHGGSYNAYTAAEHTNYFFDIDPAQLEPALDRFAQFFVAPLFDADYIERERHAVHSEYKAGLNDDRRRIQDVYRELMNPAHPLSRFSVGNLATLADTEETPLREDLLRFYHQYYSADLMALAVLGREPLDDLEALVKKRFSPIPKREVTLPESYPSLFSADRLPQRVDIVPEKETRHLSLLFPMPNVPEDYPYKPLHYLSHLLGHEGEGSLLSLLKELGWGEGIRVGPRHRDRHDQLFQIAIDLTELGVRAADQIVALVFHNIEQTRTKGLDEWRYRELQQMADYDFRFDEKQSSRATVSGLAMRMHLYEPGDILRGDSLYAGYDARRIRGYFRHLRSDNVLVSLIAPEVEPEQQSAYYQTPYRIRSMSSQQPEIKKRIQRRMTLPEPNAFIPSRLEVKEAPLLPGPRQATEASRTRPEQVVDKSRIDVWYQWDAQFGVPKTSMRMRLMLPNVAASVEGAARAELVAALVEDQLNEFAYPAQLAGLDFEVSPHARGMDIEIFGYNGRQNLLLTKIVEALRRGRFEQERFDVIKRNLLREWRNEALGAPYVVIARQIPRLQYAPLWLGRDKLDALENTDLEALHQFTGSMLKGVRIEALLYGNLYRQEAVRLSAYIEHQLLGAATRTTLAPGQLYRMRAGAEQPWWFSHPLEHDDQVVMLYLQGLSTDIEDAAHMQLLRQMLRPAFFHELRTEKQLGYVATLFSLPIREQEGVALVVQSPSSGVDELYEEIDSFLAGAEASLETDFEEHRQALVRELREPAQSLYQQSSRHWRDLMLGDQNFDRRERLARAMEEISLDSLKAYYRSVFADPSRRLWLGTEALDPEQPVRTLEDLEAYRRSQEVLIYP